MFMISHAGRFISAQILILIFTLSPLPHVHVASNDSGWEIVGGVWDLGRDQIKGQGTGSAWGIILSREWFGETDLSGSLALPHSPGGDALASIYLRYAGPSESYALVFNRRGSKITLLENHLGRSREAISVELKNSGEIPHVSFHIKIDGEKLTARLWPGSGSEEDAVTLRFQEIKVPEGRVGFGVRNAEITCSNLRLKGQTESSFANYAFHCNYRLRDKVAQEPLWQYLDAVGTSPPRTYPTSFNSIEEFEKYKRSALLQLRRSLGLDPWPERTPLNPRTVGVVERGDYKIEKIIFESQPGFLVNALLYLPKKAKFPVPGILSPIGHYADQGFFIWSEQGRCIGLARKGYAVLTYDPISQGERQWLGKGVHDTLRRKIILSGMEVSGLMFWDSIRGIDYLVSRPEVDPEKIGVTGVSGGGFNTLYTAVLDERVKAVAPCGYATTTEALIKRASAGCCSYLPNLELFANLQNIYSLIAPRKLLILGGLMDILSDRLLQIYESAKSVYALYGAEDNIQYYVDPDAGHTYSKPMRLAMYRHFNRWLKGINDPAEAREARDPEDSLISKESGLLKVFPAGEKGKDIIDLEREFLEKNRERYRLPKNTEEVRGFQKRMRTRLIELMGAIEPAKPPLVVKDDHQTRPGSVRDILLKTERDLPVPVRVHHPVKRDAPQALLIYFSMEDRYPTASLSAGEMVESLTKEGFTVAVPQVRGSGQTRVADMNSVMLYSMALGKHLFSTRIYDLQRVADYLLAQPEYRSSRVVIWGEGKREGVMALYLAAIDPRFDVVVSSHALVSYQDIVDKDGLPDFDYYVPGILKYADTPEFVASIAPRRVIISAPVDINNNPVGNGEVKGVYAWAENVYRVLNRPSAFSIEAPTDVIGSLRKGR
jgi:cephalosporin-C deacetylase-like acetyl esterase